MTISLADKSGFCFGVKRAVDQALCAREKFNRKIYTLGPLIHNEDVVNYLKENNIFPITVEDVDKLDQDDVIIIRSHGVSSNLLNYLQEKGLQVINATCPYVSNIQEKANKYYKLGYKIVIVGDKNHPEVVGINGWCNNEAIISKDGMDIDYIPPKICVLSQTTEKQENWEKVLNVLVKESKEILAFNTICSATSVRQKSAYELSKNADVMIVIGGRNSSNTTKLYEICKKNCINTIHVENSGEIPDEIIKNKNNLNIGVTAGASTPDWIIKEAILKMSDNEKTEMNEQLAFMEKNDNQIVVGETVKGEIISIGDKQAFLNIGYKIDGILPLEEVTKDENVKLTDILENGQSLDVKVISRRNEDGYVVLSKIELERETAFKEIKEAKENSTILKVMVKQAVNGGLVSSYKGVRIFIPASHVELYHVDDLKSYEGKQLEVKIIEVKEERRSTRIVGSRRDILKVEKSQRDKETWEKLEKDTVVEGEVKRITDFGAFVDINGVDGLLHVSEISWGRINKPGDVLKIGDRIKVYILNVDKENKKISLSMKKLMEDPWSNADVKYPVGNIVLGKVARFASFGAFVELEPGIDGLVHISQITHKRINKPEEALQIGQTVKAKILDVNKENKKIGLSIKEVVEI
jgi:small subunit ribosomal protein S1